MDKLYLNDLDRLADLMKEAGRSRYTDYAKVQVLTVMNMRYEKIAFNHDLKKHPYIETRGIVIDAIRHFNFLMDCSFIESNDTDPEKRKSLILEEKHEELWQEIWSRHNEEEFQEFIDLKSMRLEINDLVPLCQGEECVDFGCGNGSFAFALLEKGAKSVSGIDFGTESIKYAQSVAELRNVANKVEFKVGNVQDTGFKSGRFGFAVSNGVFHHLGKADIPKALNEVARVLKPGGWVWYYVDGKGAISMDLWDRTVEILKDVDVLFIEKVLQLMNVSRNKMVHIMDGSSATYLHHDYDEVVRQLSDCGFHNFKRLSGGTRTDFDLDVVGSVPYGTEKFGSGDIRVICQLI